MISQLSISNYALIRELQISPDKGLNMITGETGAGKSIMLGALGLLLGKRADVKSLLDREAKCIIEAEFSINALKLHSFFEELDLDYEDDTIIRREISPKGKSRAFVNDIPVTLDVLKTLGVKLIDIHSQNESLQLGNKEVKLQVIDGFSQSDSILLTYQKSFTTHLALKKRLETLQSKSIHAKKDEEYKKYLLEELIKADLQVNEQEKLEADLVLLENAEEIKLELSKVQNEYTEHDLSINDRMKSTTSVLKKLSRYTPVLEKLSERFETVILELEDIISELSGIEEDVEYNPERMSEIQQRLDLIFQLQQKHQVNSTESLLTIQERLENEIVEVNDVDDEISRVQSELEKEEKDMLQHAESLSEMRRESLDSFCEQITSMIKDLGMPEGFVEIAYKRISPWKMGIDEVEFLFTANKGIKPEPLSHVASGGEFSRLMFCIKYILASKNAMPTVIFDEIDTGVSGEIAIKLAQMMLKMSENHQLITISHLPQVAAQGNKHYHVFKDNSSDQTISSIKELNESARLEEIAKMIGGDNPSDIALSNAKELIGTK